jgi:hypothetical protein
MEIDISPLEAPARTLCELRGQDPDEMIRVPSMFAGVENLEPLWHAAAQELLMVTQCLTALKRHAPKPQEH